MTEKPDFQGVKGGKKNSDPSEAEKPDFKEAMGGQTSSSTSSSSDSGKSGSGSGGSSKSKDDQLIIKSKYGNKIRRRDEGCVVCGDEPVCVVVQREEEDGDHGLVTTAKNVCQTHRQGAIMDLEQNPGLIVEREY